MTKFTWWYPVLNRPDSRWGWLAPLHALPLSGEPPRLPWGWRYFRCCHRHAVYPMPTWLFWCVSAWVYRWWVLEYPVRWGWLTMPDGGYWHDARPWFWNAERETSFRAMWRGLPQ